MATPPTVADVAATATAATTRLVRHLHSLNTLLMNATSHLQTTPSPSVFAQLAMRHSELKYLFAEIGKDNQISGQDWILRWVARGVTSAGGLRAATEMCVASLAKFFPAAIAVLQKVESANEISHHVANTSRAVGSTLFKLTWSCTESVCRGFMLCGMFAAGPAEPDLTPLQPVFRAFMAWLHNLMLHSRATQQALQGWFNGEQLQHIYVFMDTSIFLVFAKNGMPLADSQNAISHLPSGFISTLCCLACEVSPWRGQGAMGFEGLLLKQTGHMYMLLIVSLGRVLGTFVALPRLSGSEIAPHQELVCPTAVEVAKLAVFASCFAPGQGTSVSRMLTAQHTLQWMLIAATCTTVSHDMPRRSPSSGLMQFSPSITSGSGSSALSPRWVTHSPKMLLLLLQCTTEHPCCLETSTGVISMMVNIWFARGAMCMASWNSACISLVLRYCSKHLCCIIQRQRYAQQQRKSDRRSLCADAYELTETQRLGLQMLMTTAMELSMMGDPAGE